MKSRTSDKKIGVFSVLLVCEGQNTERMYFNELEKYLAENFKSIYPNGIKFSIFPYVVEEDKVDEKKQFLSRKVGKRRSLKFESIISDDVEEEYSAAPIRWVRYAQKKAEDSGYNEAWSVFDYDNRDIDLIKQAYNLADKPIGKDDPKVGIAYSSYSFEYWLLLHYELYLKYLGHSECKHSKKREIVNCANQETPKKEDCKGLKCLGGYMRSKGYEVGFYNKSVRSTFPAVEKFIKRAIFHSTFVRSQPANLDKEIWEMRPVTTMDKLIEGLIKFPYKIRWGFEKNRIVAKGNILEWSLGENNYFNLKVSCASRKTVLIAKGEIQLLDLNFEECLAFERIVIQDGERSRELRKNISQSKAIPVYISVIVGREFFISGL